MRTKKDIVLLLQRSIFHLKTLRVLFFLPIVLMDVLLPILIISSYKSNGAGEMFLVDTKNYCLSILPLSSIFWSVFAMKDYVGEIGVETLFISKHKIKLLDFAILLIYQLINILIIAGIVFTIQKETLPIFIAVFAASLFLFGLSYCLLFYSKSLTIVIMVDVLYIIASLSVNGVITLFPLYIVNDFITYSNLLSFYLPLGAIGVVLCGLGVIKNRNSCI